MGPEEGCEERFVYHAFCVWPVHTCSRNCTRDQRGDALYYVRVVMSVQSREEALLHVNFRS